MQVVARAVRNRPKYRNILAEGRQAVPTKLRSGKKSTCLGATAKARYSHSGFLSTTKKISLRYEYTDHRLGRPRKRLCLETSPKQPAWPFVHCPRQRRHEPVWHERAAARHGF